MPSPADRIRWERLLRAASLLLLAVLIVGALLPRPPGADSLRIHFTSAPDAATRDSLKAVRATGTAVAWESDPIRPLMLELEPLQDPASGLVVRVAGGTGPLLLADSLGPVDSISLNGIGGTVVVPSLNGALSAEAGRSHAIATVHEPAAPRSVLVLGVAGWEAKFVVRALAERGWQVNARLALAPGKSIDVGAPFPIDTARYAAVIALDSSAAGYRRQLVDFVLAGGGLVLGEDLNAGPYQSADDRPVTLAQRDDRRAISAWRFGAGRVVQNGNPETWRWRMAPGDSALAHHRAWWAALVATIASRSPAASEGGEDPAPLAALTLALGPSTRLPETQTPVVWWPWVMALLGCTMIAEWASRRLRGAM